jgi:pyridoxamine 5'-phosphate oxidase-like protein
MGRAKRLADDEGRGLGRARRGEEAVMAIQAGGHRALTREAVWRELERASFAVLAHLNDAGEPRSSGVVYGVAQGRLYVVVAADGWKAHDLHTGDQVAVTVPVRRGGLLALLFPIPPATISFHATVTAHEPGAVGPGQLPADLARLLPEHAAGSSVLLELVPVGAFLTYGIGVPLLDLRRPEVAHGRVAC